MTNALMAWLTDPHPSRGVHLAEDAGGWTFHSYPDLAISARRVATALIDDGVRPGDVVCVLMPTGFQCLSAIFGTWAAGAAVCLVAPPAFATTADYPAQAAAILQQAAPVLTVVSEDLAPVAEQALAMAGLPGREWIWREAAGRAALREPADLALLQFTSGSSGQSRGVRVTWDNLMANIEMIQHWLTWRDGDSTVSWLPLYHDMGLIGCLLTTVAGQGDLSLMRPAQFIRDPYRWLDRLTTATHTASPPFGFDYTTRRLRPDRLSGMDLSRWRTAIVGAEPIDPGVLERFALLAEPAGFTSAVYLPAYGLAEATLAVSGDATIAAPLLARPAPESLRFGEKVHVAKTGRLGTRRAEPGWLVGCGTPGPGVELAVLDHEGRPLPEGHLGEIAVTGRSTTHGYQPGRAGSATRYIAGQLRTGDAGFLHSGQLFVLGRMGDSLKVRGRSVYVEDLESTVVAETGLARSKCAVVSMAGGPSIGVVLFAEAPDGRWAQQAYRVLRAQLGPEVEIRVVAGGSGLIRRTSSGKPRRRHMWERLRAGRLVDARTLLATEGGA